MTLNLDESLIGQLLQRPIEDVEYGTEPRRHLCLSCPLFAAQPTRFRSFQQQARQSSLHRSEGEILCQGCQVEHPSGQVLDDAAGQAWMVVQQPDDRLAADEPQYSRLQSHNRRWILSPGERADFVENLARAHEAEGLLASFWGHPDGFEPTFSDHVETGARLSFQKHDLVGPVLAPRRGLDHGIQRGVVQCGEVRH